MYKEKFVIGSNDVDCFLKLKVSSLFMFFQDVATHAVADLKLDGTHLRKYNVDWIITSMTCEIYRIPDYMEELKIFTYPGKDLMFLYPRHFYVEDKKGRVIARCSSVWALLDQTTRKLATSRDFIKGLTYEQKKDELPLPKKNVVENTVQIDNRKIYYSEIDLNGHLNNCSYVKLVVDTKSIDFYKEYEISKLTLNFLKEIKQGDKIEIFSNNQNPNGIEFKRDDELCFTATVDYRKK